MLHTSRIQAQLVSTLSHVSHVSPQNSRNSAHIGCWGSLALVLFVVVFGFGFCLCLVLWFFGLLPLPICRVSILPTMTWAHRPHSWKKHSARANPAGGRWRACNVAQFVRFELERNDIRYGMQDVTVQFSYSGGRAQCYYYNLHEERKRWQKDLVNLCAAFRC